MTTIYHNPACSKSRAALVLLRHRGIEPKVVRYLDNPPDAKTLKKIVAMLDVPVWKIIREHEPLYYERGFKNVCWGEQDWLETLPLYPVLIERPIVVHNGRAAIGRPLENVIEILKTPPMTLLTDTVNFTKMADGTAEEYAFLQLHEQEYLRDLPARLVAALQALDDSFGGYQVSRLEHSLQSATRAEAAGEDEEVVVAALLHDLGDTLAPLSHSELAAAVLRPFVSPRTHWIVKHHGVFQMYYYAHHTGGDRHARDRHRDHEWYQACVDFCERYDQNCFDPNYQSKPLEHFVPMLKRVFAKPREDF